MKFRETVIPGVFAVGIEPAVDPRGSFARTFCAEEFRAHGLNPDVAQCSVSVNQRAGTLRGLHYQEKPHAEAKLVGCLRGRLYDVVLDIRPWSPTFRRWVAFHLAADDGCFVYVPEGVAHGFQTLADDTIVSYQISVPYAPGQARGIRWNDPMFAVRWPLNNPILSDRDRSFPDYEGEDDTCRLR